MHKLLPLTAVPEAKRTIKFDSMAKTEDGTGRGKFVPYSDTAERSKEIVELALKQRESKNSEEKPVVPQVAYDSTDESADEFSGDSGSMDNATDDSESVDDAAETMKPAWRMRTDPDTLWELVDLVQRNEKYLAGQK